MSQQIKVKDKRMFDPDGRLREEFRHVEEGQEAPADPPRPAESPGKEEPAGQVEPGPAEAPEARHEEPGQAGASAAEDAYAAQTGERQAGFMDLVGLLAEHASIYLQQGRAGRSVEAAQSLEVARLHIDLLAVLKEKTAGNLTAREQATLDEVLYQLRLGFMEGGG